MVGHTPGPWETGCWYDSAGVNDGSIPDWKPPADIKPGDCALCANPEGRFIRAYVEEGRSYHVHRFPDDSWRQIHAVDGTLIVGNYDYEEGGVCTNEADARLIAAAPRMLAHLMVFLIAPSGAPICACRNINMVKAGLEKQCWYCEARAILREIEGA